MLRKRGKKEFVLGAILIVQILFIIYCNFFLQTKNIDSDMARLYVHAIEMFRNHSYYIPDWSYVTTAEWDCSLLFAVPFYGITHNIYASFACANMVFLVIWMWTVFRMFKGKERIYPLFCLNLIFIPYGIGMLSYFNMLFFNGGQYVVKVLLPIMLLTIIIELTECKHWKWQQYLYVILYAILLLISIASSGMYVFLCGICPCLFAFFLHNMRREEKISKWLWIVIACNLLIVLVGYCLNIKLAVGSKGNAMVFCVLPEELHKNIVACFWGFFELFGGATYWRTKIVSYEGIIVLIRMSFTGGILWCGYITLKRLLQGKEYSLRDAMLIMISLINTVVLFLCNDMQRSNGLFEFRYHLIGAIPLMILTGEKLIDYYKVSNIKMKYFLVVLYSVILFGILFDSYREILTRDSSRYEFRNICGYAQEYGVSKVYFDDYEGAEICRLFDDNTEYYYFITNEDTAYTFVFDYYENYKNQSVDLENALLVLYAPSEDGDIELWGKKLAFIAREGEYGVYAPIN